MHLDPPPAAHTMNSINKVHTESTVTVKLKSPATESNTAVFMYFIY